MTNIHDQLAALAQINLTRSPCLNSPYGEYERGLLSILTYGTPHEDRTGVGTLSQFGHQLRFSLTPTPLDGSDPFSPALAQFPLITTKKVHLKSIVHELIWMLRGDTNIKYLQDNGVTIWDEWAAPADVYGPFNYGDLADAMYQDGWAQDVEDDYFWTKGKDQVSFSSLAERREDDPVFMDLVARYKLQRPLKIRKGNLGPVYGKQWRDFNGVDQIKQAVDDLRGNPNSRRILVSAWNPKDVPSMGLPPCHFAFQFYLRDGKLSCHMMQRSADAFLGIPFNIAQYALLTTMVAHCVGVQPHELLISITDFHVYTNHLPQVVTQLEREPRAYPRIKINGEHEYPWEINYEDVELIGYDPHPAIKGDVAV